MTEYVSENEARNTICDIGKRMHAKQFVAANDGNITIRIGDNEFIVTPTGVNKGELEPDMLLKSDIDGNILSGDLRPTSELFMHLNVYKMDPRVRSTCHAHCVYLSAYAIAGIAIDMAISPETAVLCGTIPVAPYAPPGSKALAESVKPFVKDYSVVLLANHGPMSWGFAPKKAWYILEAAEAFAKECTLLKYILRETRPLSEDQLDDLGRIEKVAMDTGRRARGCAVPTNAEPGRSLTDLTPGGFLNDAEFERLADLVADKLADRLAARLGK